MALANAKPSVFNLIGVLAGMLLLGIAGTLVVFPPSTIAAEVKNGSRRLQVVDNAGLNTEGLAKLGLAPAATTTTLPSALDSSDSSSSGSSLEPFKSSESNSMKTSGPAVEGFEGAWAAAGGGTLSQLVLMLCFACLYHRNAVEPVLQRGGTLDMKMSNMPAPETDDFDNTICECFSDKWVCIHGLCCPLVRMAHTNAVAGILGFWETALCWCCCSFWTVGMGPCCLMIWFRMRLKQVMKIEDHPFNDFCVTLFCPMLSICQQGTAVDTAMGYEVTGCCDLEWSQESERYIY